MNKDLIISFVVSILVTGLFFYLYGNKYSVRTDIDYLVFNGGLIFLFLFLPVITLIKQHKEAKTDG